MSDTAGAKKLLARYTKARIPFVAMSTIERSRALELLEGVAREEPSVTFFAHTLSKGTYFLADGRPADEGKSFWDAIDFFAEQMKRRSNLTLVLTEAPDLSADSNETRKVLDTVALANETGGSLVVITNGPVWNRLQRLGLIVRLDMPTEAEMEGIVREYVDAYRPEIPIEWDDDDIRQAASMLTGVTRMEAENVIASFIADGQVTKADLEELSGSKDNLFSDISGLERIGVDQGAAEVGGLAGLRAWLDEKRVLFTPEKRDELRARGLNPPRGILLVGVPGCGKSLSAKSIAANWRLPLYRLDFATVQGKYVGQSEQQLRDALRTAEDLSPCVLWIDEIEKGLAGAGSDSTGVSTRMVGQFLFWLQECKKQVFVVATANDVSMLPSELLRRGRFDELFFVDLPTAEERRDIIALHLRRYLGASLDQLMGPDDQQRLLQATDGFTGADLESTVRELAYKAIADPGAGLAPQDVLDTFGNVVPLSQTSPEKIEAIRDWGKQRAVPASGRPIGSEELQKPAGARTRRIMV